MTHDNHETPATFPQPPDMPPDHRQAATPNDSRTDPNDTARPTPWTWPKMVEFEPELGRLERWARSVRWSDDAYHSLKLRLDRIVGWNGRHRELSDSDCWVIAIDNLVRAFGKDRRRR